MYNISENTRIKYYEDKHNEIFPESKIKALYIKNNYIYCDTKFGLCKKSVYDIGKYAFKISSALNKTEYFKRLAIEIHGNKYDYSLVRYIEANTKIKIICNEHGEFEQNPNSHLNGCGCMECGHKKTSDSFRFNKNKFIEKANKKHNSKYDYSKINYISSQTKIIIICPIHGEFQQQANSHILGSGCPFCGFEHVGKINSNNPTGWSCEKWIEAAKSSKKFDSFKVYTIKCWNDDEEFYKIGRTFLKIKERFKSKQTMPYDYEVVEIFNGNSDYIFNLEHELKNINKNNKYLPKLKFNGMYECFNKIEKYEK